MAQGVVTHRGWAFEHGQLLAVRLEPVIGPGPDARPAGHLALAVVGGLTSSTFLSLFLVPVIYLLVARRGESKVEARLASMVGEA